MTKKNTSPTLVQLKLDVINHHKGSDNEYLRTQIAKDACYTSFNSIEWKGEQMSIVKNDMVDLAQAKGAEVVDIRIEKKARIYLAMEREMDELTERHKADLEVYTIVTQGEVWQHKPKRTFTSDGLGLDTEIQRILAS